MAPAAGRISRAYSVANQAAGDGRVGLHVRRVEGGRFTVWVFGDMKTGPTLRARGALGVCTMRSAPGVPLLPVAGGVGFAPVRALVVQRVRDEPGRDVCAAWPPPMLRGLAALLAAAGADRARLPFDAFGT